MARWIQSIAARDLACASELGHTCRNLLSQFRRLVLLRTVATYSATQFVYISFVSLLALSLSYHHLLFSQESRNTDLANPSFFHPIPSLTFRLYGPLFSALDRPPYDGLRAFEPASHLADPHSNRISIFVLYRPNDPHLTEPGWDTCFRWMSFARSVFPGSLSGCEC